MEIGNLSFLSEINGEERLGNNSLLNLEKDLLWNLENKVNEALKNIGPSDTGEGEVYSPLTISTSRYDNLV